MTTVRDALLEAAATLDAASASPRLDAALLLAESLGTTRAWLLSEGARVLAPDALQRFQSLVARRTALEPIAFIVGHKEFYGFDFVVDPRVLVPRPETELLIELALRWAALRSSPVRTIADIGTGSGCLAITLALLLPQALVYAVDLSEDALAVAALNAERHGVADRVHLLHGAGCAPLPAAVELLVTNPPYTVLAEVDENVRRWEPRLALDGGADAGFAVPQSILEQAPGYLEQGGWLGMEIGAWQGPHALTVARAAFPDALVTLHKDLAGLDRAVEVVT